jgi:hypothetical protein
MHAMTVWRWIWSDYYARKASPWGTCVSCCQKNAKTSMFYDPVFGSFCDETCAKDWQDMNAI